MCAGARGAARIRAGRIRGTTRVRRLLMRGGLGGAAALKGVAKAPGCLRQPHGWAYRGAWIQGRRFGQRLGGDLRRGASAGLSPSPARSWLGMSRVLVLVIAFEKFI